MAEAETLVDDCIQTTADDGAVVTVSGLLPLGAYVTAYAVEVTLEDLTVLAAYDITIYDGEDNVWQPDDSVTVDIQSPALSDVEEVEVYHMEDENAQPEYVDTVTTESDVATFTAESFSNYILASRKPSSQMKPVYVYVDATNVTDPNGTVNSHGYFTVGTIELKLPAANANYSNNGAQFYTNNKEAVANALNSIKWDYNTWLQDQNIQIEWYTLHTSDGADNYVKSGKWAWHLDGRITVIPTLYTVTYHANNGTQASYKDVSSYEEGQAFTVLDIDGTKINFTNGDKEFQGWATSIDSDTFEYKPGTTLTMGTQNVDLYAVWRDPLPTSASFTLKKVDSEDHTQLLPNAHFTIYTDKSCAEAYKFTTAVTGLDGTVTVTLPLNQTYYMKETQAPEGYEITDDTVYELRTTNPSNDGFLSRIWSWLTGGSGATQSANFDPDTSTLTVENTRLPNTMVAFFVRLDGTVVDNASGAWSRPTKHYTGALCYTSISGSKLNSITSGNKSSWIYEGNNLGTGYTDVNTYIESTAAENSELHIDGFPSSPADIDALVDYLKQNPGKKVMIGDQDVTADLIQNGSAKYDIYWYVLKNEYDPAYGAWSAANSYHIDGMVVLKPDTTGTLTIQKTFQAESAADLAAVTGAGSFHLDVTAVDGTTVVSGLTTDSTIGTGYLTDVSHTTSADRTSATYTWTLKLPSGSYTVTEDYQGAESAYTVTAQTDAENVTLTDGGTAELSFSNRYAKKEFITQGNLTVTKVVELPEDVSLPDDYTVTLTVKEGDTPVGKKDFTTFQLTDGSASFDIYGVEAGPHTYTVTETVSHGEDALVIDGVNYDLTATGTGTRTVTVEAGQTNQELVVTNTYTKSAVQPAPELGEVTLTKTVVLPEDVSLPEGYTVTLTLTNGDQKLGAVTFDKADLEDGTASETIQIPVGTYGSLKLDEAVTADADFNDTYSLTSTGTGLLASLTVEKDVPQTLAVVNTYAAVEDPEEPTDPDGDKDTTPDVDKDTTPDGDRTPDTNDDDDNTTIIEDEDTPLASTPDLPAQTAEESIVTNEEPTVADEEFTVDIVDDPAPLTSAPDLSADDTVEIAENGVPMGSLPQTGTTAEPVNPSSTLGALALAVSMSAAGLIVVVSRKREDN